MTIYHRLRVWAIKGWRIARYALMQVQPRTVHQIFRNPVLKKCDYCAVPNSACIVLECDYEVYATICGNCIDTIRRLLPTVTPHPPEPGDRSPVFTNDHRGVVVH